MARRVQTRFVMNRPSTILASLGFALLLSIGGVGCSSTIQLLPDSSVPFTQGQVDPSFKDNGNGTISVKVKHLGDPSKIASSAKAYVVWIVPNKEGASPQNVGVLKVNGDEEGEIEFTTAFRAFSIMITPEAATDAAKPTGTAVLKGTVSG